MLSLSHAVLRGLGSEVLAPGTWEISHAHGMDKDEVELINMLIDGIDRLVSWETALDIGDTASVESVEEAVKLMLAEEVGGRAEVDDTTFATPRLRPSGSIVGLPLAPHELETRPSLNVANIGNEIGKADGGKQFYTILGSDAEAAVQDKVRGLVVLEILS